MWFAIHAADGLLVTLTLRMRRRSWASTSNTNSTWKNTVGTVKKSTDTSASTWFSRNARHVCDGGFFRRGMHLETVASDTRMPSLSSSPWMRGAPHMLAVAICLMSLRTSGSRPGRPPLGRLRQLQ
jgi:hypothetical protein